MDGKTLRKRTRAISCMRIEKVVGSGTFGVVYKAVDKTNNVSVALKKIKTDRETQGFPVTAIREIKLLNLLKHHENIVYLREVVTYNGPEDHEEPTTKDKGFNIGDIFMVFEFVDFDLSGLLKSLGLVITEAHVRSYLKQLLRGVEFLHENNILHRDIKSANLLVTKGNVLKIADWGLARSTNIHPDRRLTSPVVTLWYRSPELILGSRFYGPEIDVWSVGCILGEMVTRVAMFRGESEPSQLDLIFQATGSPSESVLAELRKLPDWERLGFNKTYLNRMSSRFPHVTDKSFFAILDRLLDVDPRTRITAKDALREPYFTNHPSVEPQDLPQFDIAPVTEWMEQERQRKENELLRAQAEAREAARVERERQLVHQQQASGRSASQNMRNKRRMASAELSKFKVIRPTAAPVPLVASSSASSSTAQQTSQLEAVTSMGIAAVGVAMDTIEDSLTKRPRLDGQP